MSVVLDELERLAQAAMKHAGYWQHCFSNLGSRELTEKSRGSWQYDVAVFNEATSPAEILKLIARTRMAEAMVDELESVMETCNRSACGHSMHSRSTREEGLESLLSEARDRIVAVLGGRDDLRRDLLGRIDAALGEIT